MKKLKQNKAITLIALVITIIVLLILAGITLSLVIDENGIIAKAKLVKDRTNQAQEDEEEQLARVSNEVDKYIGSYRTLSNVNFSTSEQDTGIKWINEDKIYCQTIDLGTSYAVGNQTWGTVPEANKPEDINIPINGRLYFIDTKNEDLISEPAQVALRQGDLKYYALDSWAASSDMHVYLYIEYTKTK